MNFKRLVLFPWKMGSHSGKALADALGAKRVYADGKYQPRDGDLVVNWGNTEPPAWFEQLFKRKSTHYLNPPGNVAIAVNKVAALTTMQEAGVNVPEWTTSKAIAQEWFENGKVVVCRLKTKAHAADGIILAHSGVMDALPQAPLYTLYTKKSEEYRVHVADGVVIDIAQKKISYGVEKDHINYQIRTHTGGWIFARDGLNVPDDVYVQAVNAVGSMGLHFGAVDVGWNNHYQKATVYEVNSAPGLVGTTLDRYRRHFNGILGKYEMPPPAHDDHIDDFQIDFVD